MHVMVIGAGIAGITAAWELQRSGHTVTVLERCSEAAAETSYANAGLVAPGHAMPWASPAVPGILLKSLFKDHQAFRLKPRLDWQMLRWGARFLGQCTHRRALENTGHKYRLCRYSQSCLREVADAAGLDYQAQRKGLLYLYGSEASLRQGVDEMEVIRGMGHQTRVLGVDEVIELEPAFARARGRIAGAVHCPTDESGDCRKFSVDLAEACRTRGVELLFDCAVERIAVTHDRVAYVDTASGERRADAYVLASGVEAPRLSRPIGVDLPIYPVKGYSATFPIDPAHQGPLIGGVLEDQLIAFSRLGDRLRVTSTAEIAGYDASYKPADFAHMIGSFSALMPEAADYTRPEYWSCLRPMTPTGLPVVGATRYRNLFLNAGHGNMGWTMACGTARLVADVIDGRQPGLPMNALSLH